MAPVVQSQRIRAAAAAFLLLAIAHIPDGLFRHAFDKDAAAQFLAISVLAGLAAIAIALRPREFTFAKPPIIAISALIVTVIASTVTSENPAGSFFGDSGRFVGVATLLALIIVAIGHAQFNFESFISLIRYYIVVVEVVSLIGIAQHFNLVELPGDQGLASTLGNTDFFAAFIGTSFSLLILLAIYSSRRAKIVITAAALINLYALYLAGPLQGYLDLAFALVGCGLYALRRFIPRRELSLNIRTFLGTFGLIIWAEFIFLMPFLGKSIPVLGNDVQVQIRGNFWLAGMKEFFAHPFTGVGPDNYGNYYEQFRTLEDLSKYSQIVSNDAHSASVQTLATLGLFGTLAFLALLALLVRAILILWDNRSIDRRALAAISLYLFIYLTNSFISPITITHKYLFWAVAGVVIGLAYRRPSVSDTAIRTVKISAITGSVILLSTAAIFTAGQWNYLTHIEKYAIDSAAAKNYQSSLAIPCFMYFDAEMKMVSQAGDERAIAFAKETLVKNPRCIAAEMFLAKMYFSLDRMDLLKPHIYRLMEMAPARNETISIGMYYANRSKDKYVATRLQRVMQTLGLVYIPGKLG